MAHNIQISEHFTYDHFADPSFWQNDESFGVPRWNDVMMHQTETNDHYVMTYYGAKLAEIWPTHIDMVIPQKHNVSAALKRRWAMLFSVYDIWHTKQSRVTGITKWNFEFVENIQEPIVSDPSRHRSVQRVTATVSASERIRFTYTPDRKVSTIEAVDAPVDIVKDSAKYREFNAKLKKLKSVLFGQIKMGAYNKYFRTNKGYGGYYNDPLAVTCRETYGTAYRGDPKSMSLANSTAREMLYNAVRTWDPKQPDVTVLEKCLLLSGYLHTSDAYALNAEEGHKNMERRVTNAFTAVQQRYLRENCLTIAELNTPLTPSDETNDQNSQLLPSAGLREVQVPSEAEVC